MDMGMGMGMDMNMEMEMEMEMEADSSCLNAQVLAYQRTGQGLGELVARLSTRIYRYPLYRPGMDEDDCGDFYVYFYPRLIRILEHFHEQGKPFEHYLNSVLRWQLKSYLRSKNRDRRSRTLTYRPDFWDLPEAAETPLFPNPPAACLGPGGVLKTDSDRRRFLLLLLKNMQFLDAQELEQMASLCGCPAEELTRLTTRLKEKLARRELRLAALRTRRNRAFFKLSLLEEELSAAADAAEKNRLRAGIARARATLRLAQQRLARTPRCPTNRDLAEVLNLPKGTVDTSLFWLKKKLLSVYALKGKDTRRYA